MNVFDTLMLPNGSTIKNRIAKAAMEENMADADQAPSEALMRLYQAWADGGAGLIITGNVMVDGRAMTGPVAWCCRTTSNCTNSSAGRVWGDPAARSSGCRSITQAGRCRPTLGKKPGHLQPCRWSLARCPSILSRRMQ